MQQNLTQQTANRTTGVEVRRLAMALSGILAGFALVLIVGFAPVAVVHNAAHDTRHTAAFPCH